MKETLVFADFEVEQSKHRSRNAKRYESNSISIKLEYEVNISKQQRTIADQDSESFGKF